MPTEVLRERRMFLFLVRWFFFWNDGKRYGGTRPAHSTVLQGPLRKREDVPITCPLPYARFGILFELPPVPFLPLHDEAGGDVVAENLRQSW